jgi:hypothetical protein
MVLIIMPLKFLTQHQEDSSSSSKKEEREKSARKTPTKQEWKTDRKTKRPMTAERE